MPAVVESSSVDAFGLDPDFAKTLKLLFADCRTKGYDFRIAQGLRTPQKQAEYYCQWDKHPPSDVDRQVSKLEDAGAPWLASVLASCRDTPRTPRWQTDALPGAGWHQWGLAADCYCYRHGAMVGDGDDPCYAYYAERATQLGLRAGLYFAHPDAGHVQASSAAKATDIYMWAFIDKAMKERFADKPGPALVAAAPFAASPKVPPLAPALPVSAVPDAAPAPLVMGGSASKGSKYFKDDPVLATARLTPPRLYDLPSGDAKLRAMARSYNAVGGLVEALAKRLGIDPVAVLAVWYVESSGREFVVGEPVLRFEVHKFYKYWGKANETLFDTHFRFGGHAGTAGQASKGHAFRARVGDPWVKIHVDSQFREYEAFNFAAKLAGEEAACLSSSFGGPQIMGFNHAALGYANALDLATAFRADERWHVLGFADFCRDKGLIDEILNHDWQKFGGIYNGDGATYGPLIDAAFAKKEALAALPSHPNP